MKEVQDRENASHLVAALCPVATTGYLQQERALAFIGSEYGRLAAEQIQDGTGAMPGVWEVQCCVHGPLFETAQRLELANEAGSQGCRLQEQPETCGKRGQVLHLLA